MVILIILMVRQFIKLTKENLVEGRTRCPWDILDHVKYRGSTSRETNIDPPNFTSGDDMEGKPLIDALRSKRTLNVLAAKSFAAAAQSLGHPSSNTETAQPAQPASSMKASESLVQQQPPMLLPSSQPLRPPTVVARASAKDSRCSGQILSPPTIPPAITYCLHYCIMARTYTHFPDQSSTALDLPIYDKIWSFSTILCYYKIESTFKSLNYKIESTLLAPSCCWNFISSTSQASRQSPSNANNDHEDLARSSQSQFIDKGKGHSKFMYPADKGFDKCVLKYVAKHFKQYKHGLKGDYFKLEEKTREDMYESVPKGHSRDGWMRLRLPKIGQDARASQTHCHTTGSTSYVETHGREPTHLEFFKETHSKEGGGFVANTVEIKNKVFDELMYEEENPKRPIGFGFIVYQSDIFGVNVVLRKRGYTFPDNNMELKRVKEGLASQKAMFLLMLRRCVMEKLQTNS
ncbi:hypothetical protein Cgig2_024999 [Carnegiea gigantea]|uniref:Uncharacterized protein n=1 Tax=Carnegiea gigantea TaxID=171969 RepID=A0A9Q1JRK5_9CARY|nr:hypothetical protein Cgig2_024999 [Carnegiea gigantea]